MKQSENDEEYYFNKAYINLKDNQIKTQKIYKFLIE